MFFSVKTPYDALFEIINNLPDSGKNIDQETESVRISASYSDTWQEYQEWQSEIESGTKRLQEKAREEYQDMIANFTQFLENSKIQLPENVAQKLLASYGRLDLSYLDFGDLERSNAKNERARFETLMNNHTLSNTPQVKC